MIIRPSRKLVAWHLVPSRAALICVLTVAASGALGAGNAGLADARHLARPARTTALDVTANLRITKIDGKLMEAHGQASGTLTGTLELHLTVDSASRMTSSFVGTSRAGRLSGVGTSNYATSGNSLDYTGDASITGGSGVYLRAHARGIQVSGVMNRIRRTITMRITGRITL